MTLAPAGAALAVEEPEYEVVETYPGFELRRYSAYQVAETHVEGEFDEVGNMGFRILADFIFGNNRAGKSISMTAPVTQRSATGEKISMTAPVTQRPLDSDRYVIAFVMPREYTPETLPQPVDRRIEIRTVPARLVAARRYSGRWVESRYREHESALLRDLAQAGFEAVGAPSYARYNSPFSLWFLRRNEVLVDVVPAEH